MTDIKIKSIAAYAKAGFTVFPLDGKVPKCKWTERAYTSTPDFSEYENCNYGIVLPEEILIVDVDPRNFPLGRNVFKELKQAYFSESINTFIVKTGSGGAHLYFRKAPGAIRKSIKGFEGIDFLSKGRYVVGPGSLHPDTKKLYEAISGSLDSLAMAPITLMQALEQREVDTVARGQMFETCDPQTRQRFIVYLTDIQPAVQGQNGDDTTYKAACYGYSLGLSEQECLTVMNDVYNPRCIPPWNYEQLAEKVSNAYQYAKGSQGALHPAVEFNGVDTVDSEVISLDLDGNKQFRKTLKNAVAMLNLPEVGLEGLLRFNDFTKDIEFTRKAPWHDTNSVRIWSDKDTIKLKYFLSQGKQFEIPVALLEEAVVVISAMNTYHPIKDYLEGLKWDGAPRLENWLSRYLGAEDTPYTRAVGRRVLVAACTRVYRPGFKFDYMLVLEGGQGTGKSTTCRILGGEWYGDFHLDPTNKDTVQAMNGKWICEVSEMECQTRYESQSLKAFLSRDTDRLRLPYGRHIIELPRQCVFIGTINPEDDDAGYLKDSTGNRRYWPVKTGRISLPALLLDRDQLFAEAFQAMKNGEKIYLPPELEALAFEEQSKRSPRDPWTDVILEYMCKDPMSGEEVIRAEVKALDIWRNALGGTDRAFDKLAAKRITSIMTKWLGWDAVRVYANGIRQPGFRRPVKNSKTLAQLLEEEILRRDMGL